MGRDELPSKFVSEILPIQEPWQTKILGEFFPSEYTSRPLSGSSGFHVGHGPYNFDLVVPEFLRAEKDVGLTGMQKG